MSVKAAMRTDQPAIEHDTGLALAFLKEHTRGWRRDWYAQLVAIEPALSEDRKPMIEACSTRPSDIDGLKGWIEARQKRCNLYFAVNPLGRDLNCKASKSDIAALAYCHTDNDPRKGQDLMAERERLLREINSFPLKPTALVDSGGGYGCFWRLKEPISNNGDFASLEDNNKRLAVHFGADHCHNLDRIMRLPGTVNLPDRKKIDAGRVLAPAKLLHQNGVVYARHDFDFLPSAKVEANKKAPVGDLGNEEVPIRFSSLIKTDSRLLARWEGSTEGLNDKSRSGLDMSMAALLVKGKFTDPEIAAVLRTYPHGKGPGASDDYLRHTISKARASTGKVGETAVTGKDVESVRLVVKPITKEELTTPIQAPEFAVEPWLPRGCVTDFAGAHGISKSTIALWLQMHVSLGLTWCGAKVQHGRAVFMSREDSRRDILRRLQALAVGMSLSVKDHELLRRNLVVIGREECRKFKLTTKSFGSCATHSMNVEEATRVCKDAVSVVFETASRLHGGDELNEDVATLAEACEEIAQETGAAFMLIRHVAKDAARAGRADSYVGRGGGAFADAARSVIVPVEMSEEEALTAGVSHLALMDSQHARVIKLVHAKSNLALTADTLFILRTFGPKLNQIAAKGRDMVEKERILQFIDERGRSGKSFTERELVKEQTGALGVARKKVSTLLVKLVAEGKLEKIRKKADNGRDIEVFQIRRAITGQQWAGYLPAVDRSAEAGARDSGRAPPIGPLPAVKKSPAAPAVNVENSTVVGRQRTRNSHRKGDRR